MNTPHTHPITIPSVNDAELMRLVRNFPTVLDKISTYVSRNEVVYKFVCSLTSEDILALKLSIPRITIKTIDDES